MIPAENNLLDKRQHLLEYETTVELMAAAFFVTYLLCTVGRHSPMGCTRKKLIFFNSLGTVLQGIADTGARFLNINTTGLRKLAYRVLHISFHCCDLT